MATAENISEDILRQCLQKMYVKIVASFDPKGYILDSLFANGVLTIQERKRIEELPERRGAALLDTLLTCQKPKAIAQFLSILANDDQTSCKWIHDEVYKAANQNVGSTRLLPAESGGSSVPTNSSSLESGGSSVPTNSSSLESGGSSVPTNSSSLESGGSSLPTNTSSLESGGSSSPKNASSLESGESSVPANQCSGDRPSEQAVKGKFSFCKISNI